MSLMSNIKILVVDDELIVRESMGNWLQEEGYMVNTSENGHDALEKIKTGTYDLAVVDIKMPGMDGIELLRNIKEIFPDLPILIMTAYASVDTAVQAMKDGAFDYIVKPFDPENVTWASPSRPAGPVRAQGSPYSPRLRERMSKARTKTKSSGGLMSWPT